MYCIKTSVKIVLRKEQVKIEKNRSHFFYFFVNRSLGEIIGKVIELQNRTCREIMKTFVLQ